MSVYHAIACEDDYDLVVLNFRSRIRNTYDIMNVPEMTTQGLRLEAFAYLFVVREGISEKILNLLYKKINTKRIQCIFLHGCYSF